MSRSKINGKLVTLRAAIGPYVAAALDMRPNTVRKLGYLATSWEKRTKNPASSGVWPDVVTEALPPLPRVEKANRDGVPDVLRTLGHSQLETLAALLMTVGRLRSNDGRAAGSLAFAEA